jgi:UrcA family protein
MNPKTHRSRTLEQALLKAAMIGLCAIVPMTVMAAGQPEPAAETLTTKVSLADVELSTPEGQRVAYERLHQAARQLCLNLEALHPQSLAHYPTYLKCVDETLARALKQVSGPALAATQK